MGKRPHNRSMAASPTEPLEQNFVFAVASLALSTVLDPRYLQALWACAIVFMAARHN